MTSLAGPAETTVNWSWDDSDDKASAYSHHSLGKRCMFCRTGGPCGERGSSFAYGTTEGKHDPVVKVRKGGRILVKGLLDGQS